MKLTAQRLILDLASTFGDEPMPVRALVRIAAVFDISANSLRVSLARLLAKQLVVRDERGQYRLAPAALPVQSHVASWTRVERRRVVWKGDWIGVHVNSPAGERRPVRRRRQRALDFLGFREMHAGLWMRPRNLREDVEGIRLRLAELGLEASSPVFAMSRLDAEADGRARTLWDTQELQASYRELREAMAQSTAGLLDLPVQQAMVESFLIGGEVLRRIAYDPLLPEPILPASALGDLVEDMRAYDRLGRDRWRVFMGVHDAPNPRHPRHVPLLDAGTAPSLRRDAVQLPLG